jgi:Fe-S oxidoreductase
MGVKRDFVKRLKDDPEWRVQARNLSDRTMDASRFLEKILNASLKIRKTARGDERITYHDSCHLKRGSNVWKEPRELMRSAGYTLVEMKNSDRCCGFGGTYSFLSHPQISKQITLDKVDAVLKTGATTVAMDCPGCMIMLKGAMGKADSSVRCVHTIELLAEKIAG